jgi:hypothetical protein
VSTRTWAAVPGAGSSVGLSGSRNADTTYGKTVKIQLGTYDKAGNLTATPVRTWYR